MLKHGINIQMTALTMCILLQPPSTKGLIFLVFFVMIFVTKVMVDKEDKALRIMSWFWPLLVVYCLGVVVLRYVFQIQFINAFPSILDYVDIFNTLGFQLDNPNINTNLRLTYYVFLFALSKSQLKIFDGSVQ